MVILSEYLGKDRKAHLMIANNAVKARDDPQFERTESGDSPNYPPLKSLFDFIFFEYMIKRTV